MSKRRQYNREFKISAVRLLDESDRPLVEVARSLGIHATMLHKWRKQLRAGGPESLDESGRQERSQLLRLERENKQLRRDMEILKKTLAYLEKRKR